jgi:5-(carboxyamino)imidazole ribonucleotide mutase
MKTAKIGIVMGSTSDLNIMRKGLQRLDAMEVPYELIIASAHRTPERLQEWVRDAEKRGIEVIVAGAGGAAHLPGVIASLTLLPVIATPLDTTHLRGVDALYSIVQMPAGIPVATVGINNTENAVLLAMHILATKDPELRGKLRDYRSEMAQKIAEQNENLWEEMPETRPQIAKGKPRSKEPKQRRVSRIEEDFQRYSQTLLHEMAARAEQEEQVRTRKRCIRPAKVPAGEEEMVSPEPKKPEKPLILKVNPDRPDLMAIEEAMTVLLGGGIVAFPTDTVYGIGADATNPAAVKKLYAIKHRDPDKPIPVLIHTEKILGSMVKTIPPTIEPVLEALWPGSITIVFQKHAQTLSAVSAGETLGVRIPNNMISLGLISMVCRPVATTSANISGQAPATTAEQVKEYLGDQVDLILDGGPAPGATVSTVLSVVSEPFEILRQGDITREALQAVLGDKIKS